MPGKYALETSVSVEKSKAEIEAVLRRYGATAFASGWTEEKAVMQFDIRGKRLVFELKLPQRSEFTRSPAGRTRTRLQVEQAWEQACRSIWRSLVLLIKAMLEAVEAEIVSFETAFMPYVMLPETGTTMAQEFVDRIDDAYKGVPLAHPLLALGRGNG